MKRKIIYLISLIVVFIGVPLLSQAQSIRDVVKAFEKVGNAVKTSNNRKVFVTSFIDAKTQADLYFLSDDAKKNQKFTDHIKSVYRDYQMAANFWDLKQSGISSVHEHDAVMKIIYEEFSEAKQILKGTIPVDDVIAFFYARAENDMTLAMKDLSET